MISVKQQEKIREAESACDYAIKSALENYESTEHRAWNKFPDKIYEAQGELSRRLRQSKNFYEEVSVLASKDFQDKTSEAQEELSSKLKQAKDLCEYVDAAANKEFDAIRGPYWDAYQSARIAAEKERYNAIAIVEAKYRDEVARITGDT